MKCAAVAALLLAFLTAGCVTGSSIDRVHAGMTPDQVSAAIGPPDGTTATAGRECSRYTVLKDFWSRVPWNMSDPYYVCYTDGKVDSFGRATVAHPG
jgi:hypothetical protein